MHRDEQAVHVIDRQRVQQHVAAREAPRCRPARARSTRDCGASASRPWSGRSCPTCRGSPRGRRAWRATVANVAGSSRARSTSSPPLASSVSTVARSASVAITPRRSGRQTMTRGSASPKKYASSDLLVAGVERQVDEARAQAREVERQHLPVLVDLHGDAIARPAARRGQRVGDPRRQRREIVVVHDRPAGDQQARLLRRSREMALEQRVQIGVHRKAAHAVGSDRRAARTQPDVRLRPDYSTCDPRTPARHLAELLALDAALRQ